MTTPVANDKTAAGTAPKVQTEHFDASATPSVTAPANMLKLVGEIFEGRCIRRITVADPNGGTIRKVANYDWLENGYITRVSGGPELNKAGEYSMTVDVSYKPSQSCRLTVTSQNVEPLINALKGNVNLKTADLIKPLLVSSAMQSMGKSLRGPRGFNVVELYSVGPNGERITIIGPQEGVEKSSGEAIDNRLKSFM